MTKLNLQELMLKAKEVTQSGLPFMANKEKIEVEGNILDSTLTVAEYGYLEGTNEDTGEKEDYVVIALKEYPNNFIYGSSVVTNAFMKLEEVVGDQMTELIETGLEFKLTKQMSKNKRKYTKIEFFPEE